MLGAMKIIFMGTSDFSAVVLQKINEKYPVSAVVTNPDRKRGRGGSVSYSPVKEYALSKSIPVLQYEKVSREGVDDVRSYSPDLIITAAFGQILSQEFLEVPSKGVLNVHASLLPKYRGASPIQQAVVDGESTTGITIMKTVKAVDAGDVLLQVETPIGDKETAGELFDRLSEIGGDAIVRAIDLVECGKDVYTPQDGSKATFCRTFKREDGKLNFGQTAREIDCFVRGMTPFPTAFTLLDGVALKIFEVEVGTFVDNAPVGSVVSVGKRGIEVACKGGSVVLKSVQYENGKRMRASDFLNGHSVALGTVLG